jgi:hypothetical protein
VFREKPQDRGPRIYALERPGQGEKGFTKGSTYPGELIAAWQDGDTAQRPAFRVFRFRAVCGIGNVSPDRVDIAER